MVDESFPEVMPPDTWKEWLIFFTALPEGMIWTLGLKNILLKELEGWGWEIMSIMKKGAYLRWSWISLGIHSTHHKTQFLCQWNFFRKFCCVRKIKGAFLSVPKKLSFSYTGFFEKPPCGSRCYFLEHSTSVRNEIIMVGWIHGAEQTRQGWMCWKWV